MPARPVDAERLARDLLALYTDAEVRVLEIVASYLAKDIYTAEWAEIKLVELGKVKARLEVLVRDLVKKTPTVATATIRKAYTGGQDSIEQDLKKALRGTVKTGFGMIDERKVVTMSRALSGTLEGTHLRIARQAVDEYRTIVGKASEFIQMGVYTREQATQVALNQFADRGITGFVDKAGRNWSLLSYVEMATRTTAGQAAVEGALQRMRDNDYDLVMISFHADSCPLCEPWQGQVVSISGRDEQYDSLQEAVDDGLFHPNCGHSLGAFIDGLTEKPTQEQTDRGDYEESQRQRKLERDIRKWKKREAVAISDSEKLKASAKVREKQSNMREFILETGRKRQRVREQI